MYKAFTIPINKFFIFLCAPLSAEKYGNILFFFVPFFLSLKFFLVFLCAPFSAEKYGNIDGPRLLLPLGGGLPRRAGVPQAGQGGPRDGAALQGSQEGNQVRRKEGNQVSQGSQEGNQVIIIIIIFIQDHNHKTYHNRIATKYKK